MLSGFAEGAVFAGRYRVTRVLKSGGMGAVYAVHDEKTASERALKVMHPDIVGDPELRARFDQEARVTGGIVSDHIVQTFDAGVDEASQTPFLVMELLRGEDLGAKLKRGELPSVDDTLRWLRHAALGLDKTHAAAIVHRDLKPDNLFLTSRDDGTQALKILDFGVAKVISEAASKTTKALGTPLYMPVEQIQGSRTIGPECDRYALGHIAYAMLTGEAYWHQESREHGVIAVCMRVAEGIKERATVRAKRRRDVTLPSAFDAWFARAVARDPIDRFSSCESMIDALQNVLLGAEPAGQPRSLAIPAGEREPFSARSLGGSSVDSSYPEGIASQAASQEGARSPRASIVPASIDASSTGELRPRADDGEPSSDAAQARRRTVSIAVAGAALVGLGVFVGGRWSRSDSASADPSPERSAPGETRAPSVPSSRATATALATTALGKAPPASSSTPSGTALEGLGAASPSGSTPPVPTIPSGSRPIGVRPSIDHGDPPILLR